MQKLVTSLVVGSALMACGCSGSSDEPAAATGESLAAAPAVDTVRVTCASQLFRHERCRVNTGGGRIRNAEITREFSNPPFLCRQGDSHGFDADSVWVDHGCSAEFEVTIESAPTREQIACASNDNRYRECDSRVQHIRRIRLLRQDSHQQCTEGRTFGARESSIWVDRGCRGLFEVTGNGGGGGGDGRIELYSRENFQGGYYAATGAIGNLDAQGFNDLTESIVVRSGNWEVCEDANFSGLCQTFGPGSYSRLGSMADVISSIRPR